MHEQLSGPAFVEPRPETIVLFRDALQGLGDEPLALYGDREVLRISAGSIQISERIVDDQGGETFLLTTWSVDGPKPIKTLDSLAEATQVLGAVLEQAIASSSQSDLALLERAFNEYEVTVDNLPAALVQAANQKIIDFGPDDNELETLAWSIHKAVARSV